VLDGMSAETERETRAKGLNFVMQVGIMLKLPQLTLSTAGIFFNRFLMRHSLVSKPGTDPKALHHYVSSPVSVRLYAKVTKLTNTSRPQQIAAVSLFLATKAEENCRKTRELIVACCRVAQKNHALAVDEQSKDYWRWRDTLLLNEDVLLEALCFDLAVESPHRLLFDLLKRLAVEHNKTLRNAAWAFVNDACLTALCLRFSSKVIAAAAVYCAAKSCGPDVLASLSGVRGSDPAATHQTPWWRAHGVSLADIKRACNRMADTYEGAPPKSAAAAGAATASGGAAPEDAAAAPEDAEPSIYAGLRTPVHSADEDADASLLPDADALGDPSRGVRTGAGAKREREHEVAPNNRREDEADDGGAAPKSAAAKKARVTAGGGGGENDIRVPSAANGTSRVRGNGESNDREDGGSEEGEVEE